LFFAHYSFYLNTSRLRISTTIITAAIGGLEGYGNSMQRSNPTSIDFSGG